MTHNSPIAVVLPAALLLATALIQVPAVVLDTNQADFHASPLLVFGILLGVTAVAAAACVAFCAAIPPRQRHALAVVLYGLALYAWTRASFFPGPSVTVDGRATGLSIATGALALVVPLTMAAIGAVLALRRATWLRLFVLLLLAGILVQAAVIVGRQLQGPRFSAEGSGAIARLSATSNVLVILLDSLQSDLFEDVLRARPGLRDELSGFTFYPDTTSAAPTTYLSLPDIHAGSSVHATGRSLEAQFSEAIVQRSFLNRLAQDGYEASYLGLVGGCPSRASDCVSGPIYAQGHLRTAVSEVRTLALSGVYRIAPDLGRHLIAAQWNTVLVGHVTTGLRSLQRYAREISAGAPAPRAVFLHSMATHVPFILDPDCETRAESAGREAAVAQASCALSAVVGILRRMEEIGVYDQALVILVADHGYGLGSARLEGGEGINALRLLAGKLNPLLLVKPPRSRGALAVSGAPIALGDIGGALCAERGCDPQRFQEALVRARAGVPREVEHYEWKHAYWHLPEIPGRTVYRVDGSLFDLRAWAAKNAPQIIGRKIGFGADGDGARSTGFGWSNPESGHMWSDGPFASIFLGAIPRPEAAHSVRIDARLYGAGPAEPRVVRVRVNGLPVGVLESRSAAGEPEPYTITIPAGLLRASGDNQLLFEISEPRDPPGPDERLLGVALRSIHLWPQEEAVPGAAVSP